MINRENYEIYFIDYLEGNLEINLVDEFIEFLQKNPDLKEELDTISEIQLGEENIHFLKKDKLYKEKYDSEQEFENGVIALLEGDISEVEADELKKYIEINPDKEKELKLFQKTKLSPDQSIYFQKKALLFRASVSKRFFVWTSRIAAILIVLFTLTIFLKQSKEIIPPEPFYANTEIEKIIDFPFPDGDNDKKKKENKLIKPEQIKEKSEKPKKSIRETGRGRLDEEKAAVVIREKTNYTLLASIQPVLRYEDPVFSLSDIKLDLKNEILISEPADEEIFFADKFKERTGLDKFRFKDITKAGLKLASTVSNNKFSYQTNNEGDVVELALDSRLFAFSIPVNKK